MPCWLKVEEHKHWGTNGFKRVGLSCQGPCSGLLGLFIAWLGMLPTGYVGHSAKLADVTITIQHLDIIV